MTAKLNPNESAIYIKRGGLDPDFVVDIDTGEDVAIGVFATCVPAVESRLSVETYQGLFLFQEVLKMIYHRRRIRITQFLEDPNISFIPHNLTIASQN